MKLRGLWLQVHKWIGLILAILIIPLSVSGAALVWHDVLDEAVNPQRYDVKPACTPGPCATIFLERIASGWGGRPPSYYAARAVTAIRSGERLVSFRYPEGNGPIVATAAAPGGGGAGGRPVRTSIWLDPLDGRVLDRARSDSGLVRFLHVLHGSLQLPGIGRQIVGWIGVAMLLSSLTGLWLWWPLSGGLRRGLRWRRQNALSPNLHHFTGFWIAIPLAMLSLTGAWISFPAFFGAISGEAPAGGGADRTRAQRARPLVQTAMDVDQALAAAQPHATGHLVSITWPTDMAPEWKIAFARQGGSAEVKIKDSDSTVTPPTPPRPETLARTMRRWHDGTGMGPVWQAIIFLGGIAPALLAITGIIMWLRSRGWRARLRKKRTMRA
jgi:uncharacterized iron-regulated membrane protein